MHQFVVDPSDQHIWNRGALEQFLVDHQRNDIYITVKNEGCDCDQVGLYQLLDRFEFSSVTIETANAVEQHPRYNIKISSAWYKFFLCMDSPIKYQQYHTWNQQHIFSVFYNRPIWHRLGLFAHMYTRHRALTLINFRSDPNNADQRQLYQITELFAHDPTSAQDFLNCYTHLPIRLESQDGYTLNGTTTGHTDQLAEFYPNVLIDLVAETYVSGRTFFATEKTVRPMLLKKPMIVMAARDHLMYLRRMGFRTFNDFWDEDYDGYEGADRYCKILKLIDDLAKKSQHELAKMYHDMQPILDHNYQLLASQTYIKDYKHLYEQK